MYFCFKILKIYLHYSALHVSDTIVSIIRNFSAAHAVSGPVWCLVRCPPVLLCCNCCWTQRWCTCACVRARARVCVCWYFNYRPSSTTPTTSPYSITKGNTVRVTMPTRTYIITSTNFFYVCRSCKKIKDTHKYKLQTSIKISKKNGSANDGAPVCDAVYMC